jgi:hypothetical protein
MAHTPLTKCTSEQLVIEGCGKFTAMAARLRRVAAQRLCISTSHQNASATFCAGLLYADRRRGRDLVAAYCEIIAAAPRPTAGLPLASTAPMLPGMAWWIWALAATNAWFGVSVAIGELWAALHRSACRQSHSREAVGMVKRKQSPRGSSWAATL